MIERDVAEVDNFQKNDEELSVKKRMELNLAADHEASTRFSASIQNCESQKPNDYESLSSSSSN